MTQGAASTERQLREAITPSSTKILLVDDRVENLLTLEAILEDLGEPTVRAHSGKEALRHLLYQDFAVILLDVQMPDMDGFETAALIRERERSRHTPILFLTAHRDDEHLFKGYYAGAVDFLFKPINPEVLRSKVAVFVELSKKTALLRQHAAELENKNAELERTVAERKRAEDDVRRANAELERRVQERTAELKRSNDQLREFAYAAAHDLQEPLRTVSSYAQLLAKRYKGRLDGDAEEFMGFIVQGVQRMHALLSDLLKFSQASSNQEPLQNVADLEKILQEVVSSMIAAIQESGAEVTHDPLPSLVADGVQIGQVFQNLIGNAIKYRSDQPPRVHISAVRESEVWHFKVSDNGLGIDPQYADLVFGIFKRLHGSQYPGTGIGLALCRKIVERHGGRIWVESEPGKGSCFQFTLPIREPDRSEPREEPELWKRL